MDKQKAAEDIITHALPLAANDGWNQIVLAKAAVAAGYKKSDVVRVFPEGSIAAVDEYSRMCDRLMLSALSSYHLDEMRIRDRVALAVRLRLEQQAPHREALRKALNLQNMPYHITHGMRSVYETVDNIWRAIGDSSTDFNFYTKRATLAAAYSATLIFWLNDNSPAFEGSWNFLDNRIANIMQIEKAKKIFREWTAGKTL